MGKEMLGHSRAHRDLTSKDKPVKLRQVLIRSVFIPAETLLSSLQRQSRTRHRSVVWIFLMGFVHNPLRREAFSITAPVLQQPVLLAAGQASLQSTSAQLKLFSKIWETKEVLPWFQGSRTSDWFTFVTGPSIYPVPRAMQTSPQRLQNSLLIGVACASAGIFGARTFPWPCWVRVQAALNEVIKLPSCCKFFELLVLF